jgi:chromosome segregation ATPase
LLLDELLAERERASAPPTPPPVLSVDPVAVPQAFDTGRRALRHRLTELEDAARRNYRSAEEARRVLAAEHQRLEQELSARTHAQHEAAALRREVERLSAEEARSSAQERTRAERAARAEIADELKQFHEEHERVVHELNVLRSSLSEHDGLLDEYVNRLRDEQSLRAEMRTDLDRAEAAQSLAERSLLRATENARHGAEDEMIRLATAEQQLADARSDRDRYAQQLAELTAGDGALGRMTIEIGERDAEIGRLGVRIADLTARIDASEDAARVAASERDDARAARDVAQARFDDAVQAGAASGRAAEVASSRITDLGHELAEQSRASDERTRELDLMLGQLRREAREATNARHTAEGHLTAARAERDELRVRVADLTAECERIRSEGDQLRAHAAALGDELASARTIAADLQAAAPAPAPIVEVPEAPRVEEIEPVVPPVAEQPADQIVESIVEHVGEQVAEEPTVAEHAPEDSPGDLPEDLPEDLSEDASGPPPLPLRIAGRHAPAPLARRRPRRESAPGSSAPALAALVRREPEPVAEEVAPKPEPEPEQPPAEVFDRRTALAEFSALATSSGDDFIFRRR